MKTDPRKITGGPVVAYVAYYVTLFGIFAATFFPGTRDWGINWWTYFPLYLPVTLLVIGLAAPFGIGLIAARLAKQPKRGARSIAYAAFSLTLTVALATLFYFLRTRTHFLGDGYSLLSRLSTGAAAARSWQPVLYFIKTSVYSAVGRPGEASALLAFQVISWGSGILYLIAVVLGAVRLFRSILDRVLFVLGMSLGGYVILFFGYVENYPLFVLVVTLFALTGLMSVLGKLSRWWSLPLVVLACLFHPFGVCLTPALVFVLLANTTISRKLAALPGTVRWGAAIVVALAGAGAFAHAYLHSYVFRFALVPLWPNQFTARGYWLFSFKHLIDFGNLLILLFPALLIAVVSLRGGILGDLFRRNEYRFLLTLLVCTCGLAFIIDPDLGMPRDWDLLSFCGPVLVLLCLSVMLRDRRSRADRVKLVGMSCVLCLLVVLPRAVTLADSEMMIKHVECYFDLDPAKSSTGRFVLSRYFQTKGDFQRAAKAQQRWVQALPESRAITVSGALQQQGKPREAATILQGVVQTMPGSHLAWEGLGACYMDMDMIDSALYCLRVSNGLDPNNPKTHYNLGLIAFRENRLKDAEKNWLRTVALDSTYLQALQGLGKVYMSQGRLTEYANLFIRIANRMDAPLSYLEGAAKLYIKKGDYPHAIITLRGALAAGLDTAEVRALIAEHPELQQALE